MKKISEITIGMILSFAAAPKPPIAHAARKLV